MVVAYHLGGRLGIECRRRWLGGKWHSRTEEQKLGLSVVGQCEASRKIEASVHLAVTLFGFFFLFTFQLLRYQIYLEVRSSSGQQQHSSMMITASIVPRAELVLFPRIHQHTSQ